MAQFFDPPCNPGSLRQIDSVYIEALSPDSSGPPRLAIWLAAWLAGQLEWKPTGEPVNSAVALGSRLLATFAGPAGDVAVEIVTRLCLPACQPRPGSRRS